MDITNGDGFKCRFCKYAKANLSEDHPCVWCGKVKNYRPGGVNSFGKRGSDQSKASFRRIYFDNFSSGQEDRGQTPSDQFKFFKQFYRKTTLQDVRIEDGAQSDQTGRSSVYAGFDRRIFQCADRTGVPEVFPICVERADLPVHGHAIRSDVSTKNFHKTHETSDGISSFKGSQVFNLYRRCDRNVAGVESSNSEQGFDVRGFSRGGFCDKFQKIFDVASNKKSLSGIHCGFGLNESFYNGGKTGVFSSGVSSVCKYAQEDCKKFSKGDWVNCFSVPCVLSGATTLQGVGVSKNKQFENKQVISQYSNSSSIGNGGFNVVDSQCKKIKWKINSPTSSISSYQDRCIFPGMGSSNGSSGVVRGLEPSGEIVPYKCSGIISSAESSSTIGSGYGELSYPDFNRQFNNSLLYQQDGRYPFSTIEQFNKGDLVLGSSKEHSFVSNAHSRDYECGGGLFKQIESGSGDLDASSRNIQSDLPGKISTSDRFIREQSESSVSKVCVMETGFKCVGSGCVLCGMEGSKCICVSAICSDRQSVKEGSSGRGSIIIDNTELAKSELVARSTKHVSGRSSSHSSSGRPANRSSKRASTSTKKIAFTSRLDDIRKYYRGQKLSRRSTEIIINSWREGTSKQYQAAWSKWIRWCGVRKVDPMAASLKYIVQFLTDEFDKGLSYSTINSYRSAISTTHSPIDGMPVGQNPVIVRLLKGMFNMRPSIPKYAVTWDVCKVLEFLKSLPEIKLLTLKEITFKLLMLISLTSADRSQSIAHMDISNMAISHNKVVFYVTDILKTSRPGKMCKEIVLPSFSDKKLCVKFVLSNYLKRTKLVRGDCKKLFISYKKPHRAVSSSTLARWVRTVLQSSGVIGYGAHSTRGAATSAALMTGLPLHTILKAADWSRESTFTKFYRRGVDSSEFGRAVLQSLG